MKQLQRLLLSCCVLFATCMTASADFTLTNPGVSGSGSGDSLGTATIADTGPWNLPEPGFEELRTITPSSGAIAFQESHVEAHNGTASVSTSVTQTDTQTSAGNSVTATTSGSTSASVEKENDPARTELLNEATARLIAAGGAGTVTNSNFVNTETGFMVANADTYAYSDGNEAADAASVTDASASAKGSASVSYRFAGSPGPETVSIANANVASTGDVDGDTTITNPAFGESSAWTQGFVSWTDSATEGQAFGSSVGLASDTLTMRVGAIDDGTPGATADAAGNVNLSFVYRPIANPVFSFAGAAGGSTDADSAITQGFGLASGEGAKVAIGQSGTQTDVPALAQAWLVGNAMVWSAAVGFAGDAHGHAVNPAVLGDADVDPDPNMTVGTQSGTYSAAMGSSSLVNAEVEADVSVTPSGTAGLEGSDVVIATAFGFAQAAQDLTNVATAGTPPNSWYNLATENAFVGQGTFVGLDEGATPAVEVAGSATTRNLYGSASSPAYSGSMNNGDSTTTIAQDDNGIYQRATSASVDSATGTNYPNIIAHNQMFGTASVDPDASPWFEFYRNVLDQAAGYSVDHLATGFIGAGGN